MNRCVFLDRDGTLTYDYGYTSLVDNLIVLPDVSEALRILKQRGFLLIVITNQSGIARGKFSIENMESFNEALNKRLYELSGVIIDEFYYCPHHKDGIIEPYNCECECRKPSPLLIYRAAIEYNIDLSNSYFIGNTETDMKTGINAGLKKVFKVDNKKTMLSIVNEIF